MSSWITKIKNKIETLERISKQKRINFCTIYKNDLKLYLDENNRFRLYYKDNEFTKGPGLNTSIFSEGDWHASDDSVVNNIERPSSGEMVIYLNHNQLPLIQIWHLKFNSEGMLSWQVDMNIKEPLRIDYRKASLFLSRAYQNWVAFPKHGGFPPYFNSGWKCMTSYEDNHDFIGVFSSLEGLPSVALNSCKDLKGLLMIQNTDLNLSSRVLEVQFEEEKEHYSPGTYPFLKATIQLYPDKSVLENILKEIKEEERRKQEEEQRRLQELERLRQEEERKKQEEENKRQERLRLKEAECLKKAMEEEKKRRTIQSGPFRLHMSYNNRFHFYYKEQELTKGVGMDVGMLSEGNWHASSDSEVEITKPSCEEMAVYFNYNKLPITCIWHIKVKPEGIIIWNVSAYFKEYSRIDCTNAHLFLSKSYNRWVVPPEEGSFPSSFGLEWQRMNPCGNNAEFIGLSSLSEGFPDIVCKCKTPESRNSLLVIQNTGFSLSSRVLEIQREDNQEFYQPGIYPFFKSEIQFYSDKSVLENILKEIKEEERRKQEEEQRRLQELERLRQEEERRKQEEERKRLEEEHKQNEFKKIYIELEGDKNNLSLSEDNNICVYGDCEKLHDKISSQQGDFNKVVSRIKTAKKMGYNVNIKIGVSRFNFFKLNAIVQFYSRLLNNRIDLRSISLNFLPAKNIFCYFSEYIKELNARLESGNIRLFLKDRELPDLLWAISCQADQYNEKDLLRLLGVITEHAFIGPQTVVLDINHSCNTNCIHCWIHTPKRRLPPNLINLKMSAPLYKRIIDDAADLLCDEIIIQGDGEPLLNNGFLEKVRYAKDRGLKTLFFTNGILLNKENAGKIIDLEVNEVFCSLPAGTGKTYALVNPGHSKDTFRSIAANLKNLTSMRKKTGKNKPLLQMSHVIHNLNYHELEEMAKVDADVGADKTRFYLARLDKNIKFLKLGLRHIETIKESLRKVEPYLKSKNIELQDNIYFQIKNYKPATGYWSQNAFLKSGCPVGWFFSLILAKGEVSSCCHLRIVGRLGSKSFKEIWDSEPYDRIRAQAKYLAKNKDINLHNNVKLYDEFCNHCDTHQVILRIYDLLQKYNLRRFL